MIQTLQQNNVYLVMWLYYRFTTRAGGMLKFNLQTLFMKPIHRFQCSTSYLSPGQYAFILTPTANSGIYLHSW